MTVVAFERSSSGAAPVSKFVRQSINKFKEKQMKDLLFLDKMLTPIIITLVYQLLLLAAIFGGIVGGLNTGNFLLLYFTLLEEQLPRESGVNS